MLKHSGMATRQSSAVNHGSAGKLGAAGGKETYKQETSKQMSAHPSDWRSFFFVRRRELSRLEASLILTVGDARFGHDIGHDCPRKGPELGWVNVNIRHFSDPGPRHCGRGPSENQAPLSKLRACTKNVLYWAAGRRSVVRRPGAPLKLRAGEIKAGLAKSLMTNLYPLGIQSVGGGRAYRCLHTRLWLSQPFYPILPFGPVFR